MYVRQRPIAGKFGWPDDGTVRIKSLSEGNALRPDAVNKVELLGGGELRFQRSGAALEVVLPENRHVLDYAVVLKIA